MERGRIQIRKERMNRRWAEQMSRRVRKHGGSQAGGRATLVVVGVKSRIEDNEEIYAMVTMAFPRWHTHSSQTSLRLLLLLLSKAMPCYSMLFCREGALQLTSEPSVPYALTLVSDTLAHPWSL